MLFCTFYTYTSKLLPTFQYVLEFFNYGHINLSGISTQDTDFFVFNYIYERLNQGMRKRSVKRSHVKTSSEIFIKFIHLKCTNQQFTSPLNTSSFQRTSSQPYLALKNFLNSYYESLIFKSSLIHLVSGQLTS